LQGKISYYKQKVREITRELLDALNVNEQVKHHMQAAHEVEHTHAQRIRELQVELAQVYTGSLRPHTLAA
jgi:hypothetical protein